MGRIKGVAAALAACSAMLAVPAAAGPVDSMTNAEKIRRLDIMLMVTGLRCRTTADNFQADYGRFTTKQLPMLNQASARLKANLAARGGAAGSNRALDRLSTTMANSYGQGHPWLSCADLKLVTQNLAAVSGEETLAEAADQLLAPAGNRQFAIARR
jgi:hypothetical protein